MDSIQSLPSEKEREVQSDGLVIFFDKKTEDLFDEEDQSRVPRQKNTCMAHVYNHNKMPYQNMPLRLVISQNEKKRNLTLLES